MKTLLKIVAWGGLVAGLLWSLREPIYPRDQLLQHIPTALALIYLGFEVCRPRLSLASFLCVAAFLALHVVGARWVYTFVPYDDWAQDLFGRTLAETFGWERNHYDRLVHFSFGALFVVPVADRIRTWLSLNSGPAFFVALMAIAGISALYEVFEWGLTLVMADERAEAYNGQQGDFWDAQKDMALAILGSALMTFLIFCCRRSET